MLRWCDRRMLSSSMAIRRTSFEQASFLHILILVVAAFLSFLGVHSLDATWGSTAVRRFEREVDVFLRVETNDETWDIHQLLANSDMPLSDEDAGVMDGLGETKFEDLRLQTALQEIFDGETQHVIQFHL